MTEGEGGLVARIVPAYVAVVERRDDVDMELVGAEAAAVVRAVAKRQREFATGRWCARRALQLLGSPKAAIPAASDGSPVWPAGIVGSITHCEGWRAVAVARTTDVKAIGIDVEPNAPLPTSMRETITRPGEGTERLSGTHADRVLFCAKEALYKAWSSLDGPFLEFHDAHVRLHEDGRFDADLLVDGPLHRVIGLWIASDHHVGAAVVLPA